MYRLPLTKSFPAIPIQGDGDGDGDGTAKSEVKPAKKGKKVKLGQSLMQFWSPFPPAKLIGNTWGYSSAWTLPKQVLKYKGRYDATKSERIVMGGNYWARTALNKVCP